LFPYAGPFISLLYFINKMSVMDVDAHSSAISATSTVLASVQSTLPQYVW